MKRVRLEETLGLAHRRLDVQRLDVLPVLLQQRDEEVDGQHDVGHKLVLSHLNVANGNTETQHLLELELDGGLDLVHTLLEVVRVRHGRRELARLRETGAEQTRDLLDESLRGQESVVLLSELLDQLLVLVELLKVLDGHVVETDQLRTVNVRSIGENAQRHTGTRDVRKLDGTAETLVTLRVVVLQTNLKLDRLNEVAALLLGTREDVLDARSHT